MGINMEIFFLKSFALIGDKFFGGLDGKKI